jgi:hypothetical protein
MANVYYVSLAGDDTNSGTDVTQPFRHVQRGVDELSAPGDVLKIRGGTYVESVIVDGKVGDNNDSGLIRIESYEGELVRIDAGYRPEDAGAIRFRNTPNGLWRLADGELGELGEYVSRLEFDWNKDNQLNRGAFVDVMPYTRLICYSNINDLRSTNERYGRLLEGEALDGPLIVDEDGEFITVDVGMSTSKVKRPWVYMGPGIFHNPDDNRVHIRLAPTSHGVVGLSEYQGETDPNNLSLSLSRESTSTLTLRNCRHVALRDLSVRFGAETIRVQGCQGVQFDHVRIYAGGKGVELANTPQPVSDIVFSDCEFDGGVPPWFFRTDEKGGYRFKDADGAPIQQNKLGAGTSGLLFAGPTDGASGIEIHHCEFSHGHDLQLVGDDFRFHHNWVDNMQDDALAVGFGLNSGDIFCNVITRCQTAMSFAGSVVGGPYRIFRNLFDLRQPVAAIRLRPANDLDANDGQTPPFRFGQMYKGSDDVDDGPIDFFQNTCLLKAQAGKAAFQLYHPSIPDGPRRSFNNIIVDIEPFPLTQKRTTAFVPTFVPGPWPSDGNCYFRIGPFFDNAGPDRSGLLRHEGFTFGGKTFPPALYEDLSEFRAPADGSAPSYFAESKVFYSPGYEGNSVDTDPAFRTFQPGGEWDADDDLRLRENSLAKNAGVVLSAFPVSPPIIDPFGPPSGRPDMGCFQDDQVLHVGVEGRIRSPMDSAPA